MTNEERIFELKKIRNVLINLKSMDTKDIIKNVNEIEVNPVFKEFVGVKDDLPKVLTLKRKSFNKS